eukprot:TRINITY_DN31120_c0_g1_i1.p1 TRINITY_DN31120_c0_g1~~TRINITY_DN31120_c0_g1_i1.p1  ORF type:complete len:1040 (+),score=199.50 TRINITY_DN31120_c0_g1_i1:79-3120(+)
MPTSFKWRDKVKSKDKQSKKAFKQWFSGKKKSKEVKQNATKGKSERKHAGNASVGGRARLSGRGNVHDGEHGQLKDRVPSQGRGAQGRGGNDARRSSVVSISESVPEGVTTGLLEQFLAKKRQLLASGADDGTHFGDDEDGLREQSRAVDGSNKGVGKTQSEQLERKKEPKGRGKGSAKQRGEGKGKGNEKSKKKIQLSARIEPLWIAPPEEVDREGRWALNKQIADRGKVRDLQGVRATLADLEKRGWANGHTYAAAVNALCRCGDWKSAYVALRRAEAATLFRKGAGAVSGVIARTAMMRGLCESARQLGRAKALLERMEKQELVTARPNVRTANTFLRGCLLLGAVGEAEELLGRMEHEWSKDVSWRDEHGGAPDASSYEMVVLLLCQALRHKDALVVANRAVKKLGPSSGSAAMFVAIARAAAVRGDFDSATSACQRAKSLLQKEEGGTGDGSAAAGSGGKRGMLKKSTDEDGSGDARTRSLEVFQSHRRGELLAEVKEVSGFIDSGGDASEARRKQKQRGQGRGYNRSIGRGGRGGVARSPRDAVEKYVIDLTALWSRTVSFDDFVLVCGQGAGGPEDPTSVAGAAQSMARRLQERLGLGTEASKKKEEAKTSAGNDQVAHVRSIFEIALHAEAPLLKVNKSKRRRLAAKAKAKACASPASVDDNGTASTPAVEESQHPQSASAKPAQLDLVRLFSAEAADALTRNADVEGEETVPNGEGKTKKKKKRRFSEIAAEVETEGTTDLVKKVEERPLHLELCSGGGEWLCSQALADTSVYWVACELRFDRVTRCFQRFALRGLASVGANAGLIAGDAREALTHRLTVGSVARLFVNHPEPPHQTNLAAAVGGDGEATTTKEPSEGARAGVSAAESTPTASIPPTHLLTPDFLCGGCAAVLRPGGTLTICTDSEDYGLWLMRTFAKPPLTELFEDALRGTEAHKDGVHEREGKVFLRNLPPPKKLCGADYTGEAGASYFQRLKSLEKNSRREDENRFFLCFRRRDTAEKNLS